MSKKRKSIKKSTQLALPAIKCLGTTTIGERGQIVIPVAGRQSLRLKPGDKMVVFVNHAKMLSLLKADVLRSFIDTVSREFRQAKILTNHKR